MSFLERMHPKHSRMEWDVLEDLASHNLHPKTDMSFPILSTIPDYYFPDKRVAVYLDGRKVHLKRQDRDEWIREKLAKRHGVKVLSITYDGRSKQERARIVREIREFLEG